MINDGSSPSLDSLTDAERLDLRRFLQFPEEFPPVFVSWLSEKVAVDGHFTTSQVDAFKQYLPQFSVIPTGESGAPNQPNYGDLATVGPKLEGLAAGKYLALYGFSLVGDDGSGTLAKAGISINGATPVEADTVPMLRPNPLNLPIPQSAAIARVYDLPLPSNSLKLQYQDFFAGDAGVFANRFLITLRVS